MQPNAKINKKQLLRVCPERLRTCLRVSIYSRFSTSYFPTPTPQVAFLLEEPPGVQLRQPREQVSSWLHPRVDGKEALAMMEGIRDTTPLAGG